MIYTWENRSEAFEELVKNYPGLAISDEQEDLVQIEGTIFVNRRCEDYRLSKEYGIRLIIFKDENNLPEAFDITNQVDSNYRHRYPDGGLCLDTDSRIRICYENGLDLCLWMHDFVETYFFSYEYYKRNGKFPFGERSHGIDGTIEMYGELFHVKKKEVIVDCMKYVSTRGYHGHDECPCGSKKYIRKCHKRYLLPFYNNKKRLSIVKKDYNQIQKERFRERYAKGY